jgi:hypothetical protein
VPDVRCDGRKEIITTFEIDEQVQADAVLSADTEAP